MLQNGLASREDGDEELRDHRALDTLSKALWCEAVSRGDHGACWFDFRILASSLSSLTKDLILDEGFSNTIFKECGTNFCNDSLAFALSGGGEPQNNLSAIFRALIPWDKILRVIKVEAIRHITDGDAPRGHEVSGGEWLIIELRRLRIPGVREQFESQKRWDRFERFARDILNDPDAEVATDAEARQFL